MAPSCDRPVEHTRAGVDPGRGRSPDRRGLSPGPGARSRRRRCATSACRPPRRDRPTRPPTARSGRRGEADRALGGARAQAAVGLHNWACFAAEEAVQLALKAPAARHRCAALGPRSERARPHHRTSGTRGSREHRRRAQQIGPGTTSRRGTRTPIRRVSPVSIAAKPMSSRRSKTRPPSCPTSTSVGRPWMEADVIARRRAERQALIGLAREHVRRLSGRVPIVAAYVAGSVARGDFNAWSDVDLVIVANDLPVRVPDRTAVVMAAAPPRVPVVGFTPEEFERARARGNPLVVEALERGVALRGAIATPGRTASRPKLP